MNQRVNIRDKTVSPNATSARVLYADNSYTVIVADAGSSQIVNHEARSLASLGPKTKGVKGYSNLGSSHEERSIFKAGTSLGTVSQIMSPNKSEENQRSVNPNHPPTEVPPDVDAFRTGLAKFRHRHEEQDLASSPLRRSKRTADQRSEETSSTRASPARKRRKASGYAPPSKYAHLPPLQDVLEPGLICIFVGTNPGVRTATAGHAYAHPSNLFWKLLHSSGCTDVRLRPEQDVDLPRLYSMGNTNIVERPSKDAGELSKAETAAGTPILEEKVRKFRPEAVCIVGKGIWEAIWRWRYKRELKKDEFKYGWQDDREKMGAEEDWAGAPVFVATSTSGLSASLKPPEKEAIWKPFGEFVQRRRKERAKEWTRDDQPDQ